MLLEQHSDWIGNLSSFLGGCRRRWGLHVTVGGCWVQGADYYKTANLNCRGCSLWWSCVGSDAGGGFTGLAEGYWSDHSCSLFSG